MMHPLRSDFDTAVSAAGVNVTFKPTGSKLRRLTSSARDLSAGEMFRSPPRRGHRHL
jgi:hypothetical protein